MDIIQAPYLLSNDSLLSAVEKMSAVKSPVLVVWDKEKNVLFTSRTVFTAYQSKLKFCSELDPERGIELVDFSKTGQFVPDINDTDSIFQNPTPFERALDAAKLKYGIVYEKGREKGTGILLVVSRHEYHMDSFRGSKTICVCTGDDHHMEEGKPGLDKKRCYDCIGIYHCTVEAN